MEDFTPTTTPSSSTDESSKINSAMVDKIADIFAQINAKKAEISSVVTSSIMTDPVFPHHVLPRQCSLPSLSLPYMPRTPPKESYTLEDFQCRYCHRPFFSKRELTKHTESVHFIEVYKPSHWCSVCTSSFSTNKELTKHMQSYHGEIQADGGTTCKMCYLKFQHPRLLVNHMTLYHIPHMGCSICSKSFSDVTAVWKHLMSEHKVKPKEIKCNLCDNVFESPEEYDDHNKVAHAFPCMLCQRSVESREKLQDHLEEAHNKHFCADCAEIFNEFEGFVQHYITNEKCSLDPYKLICRYCNGVFPNLKLLFKHLCLDSFKCVFCETSSISCKTFQSHMETSHHTKLRYINLPPSSEQSTESESIAEPMNMSQHRLVPTIVSDFVSNELTGNRESNGSKINYIHNLIQVNENLLKSKPSILSKYSSASSDSSSSQSSALKLYNTPEQLMKYWQTHVMQSISLSSNDRENIKTEPDDMDCSQDTPETRSPPRHPPITKTDSSDSLLHQAALSPSSSSHPQPNESFSSLELEEDGTGSDKGDLDMDIDGDSSESRRNSLRQKYQQLSISRMGRRSSKSLNKMLSKAKVEEVGETNPVQSAVANAMCTARMSFTCQRCSKTFVNRSLLSRHWGSSTKCYICSKSMCDLKVLNEHMKSEHAEYSDQ
ncbi:hypothetical protein ACHWQZ_G002288 [Mnemiopsis leidyi]